MVWQFTKWILLIGLAVVVPFLLRKVAPFPDELWEAVVKRFPANSIDPEARIFRKTEFDFGEPTRFWSASKLRWGWFEACLDGKHLHFRFAGDAPNRYKGQEHMSIPLGELEPPAYDGEYTCWLGPERRELWIYDTKLIQALRQKLGSPETVSE